VSLPVQRPRACHDHAVTVTRTPRLGVEQWSSGSDSPSRTGFNQDLLNLESKTAIDQRTPAAALPTAATTLPVGGTTPLVAAEFFQRTLDLGSGATAYALYRTDSGGTWHAQAWVPERLLVRPPDTVPAVTAEALRVEHTGVSNGPGLSVSWDGAATLRKQLILGGSADGTVGRLSIGGLDSMPAAVRARITPVGSERGLEIKAGDVNVTELLRLIEFGGSTVLTVTGAGQMSSTQGAAFGGTPPAASAALAASPNATGAINTGILGYGQETAPTRVIWQVNRFQPGSSDVNPIFSVAPNAIVIGRVSSDWTGELDLGAALTKLSTPRLAWFPTAASQSGSTPFNPFPGMTGFVGIDATNGLSSTISALLNNYGDPTRDAARLYSYPSSTATWTGDIQRGYQAEIISGAPDVALVSRIDPQGRSLANAPWRGSGGKPVQLRDLRQGVVHASKKIWVVPGDYPDGQFIASNGSFTYDWPTMTVRSASVTQLEVEMRLEALFFKQNSGANPDRQVLQIRWFYSIAGGSFVSADPDYQEAAATTVDSPWPQAPGVQNIWTVIVPVTAAAGTTFRMRMQALLYAYASDGRLRRADLRVRESIVETYTAA
jgi:hypothetical protein